MACPLEDQDPPVTNGNITSEESPKSEEQPCSLPEEVPELAYPADKATASSAAHDKPVHW